MKKNSSNFLHLLFENNTPMKKILLPLAFVFISFQIANSQPSMVTVKIKPDSSVTSGNVVFHCTITNPTNKKYRYFVFNPNCEKNYYPNFWKILIKKDTTIYVDCSMEFVMIKRYADPDVKLFKNSIRTFDFCLNFNKLSPGSEFPDIFKNLKPNTDIPKLIKEYNNESYGTYEVQILYLKDPYDPQNPLSLISNWTKVKYVQK